jgi:hypothetical protein
MSARTRTGLRAAAVAVGVASVALLATPAWAGPAGAPGNNGTVKIHDGAGEPSPEPQNEPHVCTFHVHALNFDSGQVLTFTVQSWEPTGDRSVVLTGSITADATGEGRSPEPGAYGLPDGHYRLTVDTGNGASTQDKHKMFWVKCAPATTPPPSTSPPTSPPSSPPSSPGSPPTSPGSSPSPPSGPGTPTSGAPSSPGAPTTPSAGGIPPAPPGTPPSAGGLASTGSATAAIAGVGLALLLAGFVLLRIPATRRRLLGD